MIKIAALGVITVLIAVLLKEGKAEYGTYIALAGSILIFFFGIQKLQVVVDALHTIQGFIRVNDAYFAILLKIVGITYIAEFAASLCKDAGYGAVSGQVEFVGKISVLTVSLPVFMALLESIQNFL